MLCVGLAPLAIFFEVDLALDFLLVLAGPVVGALALLAREFYESLL